MTPFLDGAMHYTLAGIPVFPVVAGGKVPLTGHGCKDATLEPEQVMQWREEWPDANVGAVTGIVHDVLDIDPEGLDTLSELAGGDDAIIPCGPVVRTPRGGAHFWYLPTGLGNKAGFKPGLDWRGVGGYAIAPPSVGTNGEPYEWHVENGETFDLDRPRVPVPRWLRALLEPSRSQVEPGTRPAFSRVSPARAGSGTRGRKYALAALRNQADQVAHATEGARNDTLNRAAYSLAQFTELDDREVEDLLLVAARGCGLSEREAICTIRSGLSRRTR